MFKLVCVNVTSSQQQQGLTKISISIHIVIYRYRCTNKYRSKNI